MDRHIAAMEAISKSRSPSEHLVAGSVTKLCLQAHAVEAVAEKDRWMLGQAGLRLALERCKEGRRWSRGRRQKAVTVGLR